MITRRSRIENKELCWNIRINGRIHSAYRHNPEADVYRLAKAFPQSTIELSDNHGVIYLTLSPMIEE